MTNPIGGRFVVPNVVVTQFNLNEGDLVADFGAGSGFFMQPLSKSVGDDGKVYLCEIQKQLVETIGNLARQQGVGNVSALWCDLEEAGGIPIADSELDAAILVNTLFMIEDKETAIIEMARTMRQGAKFFVIDWTESFAGMGPQAERVITAIAATALIESHGFVLEREYPTGEHHYGLAFRKI